MKPWSKCCLVFGMVHGLEQSLTKVWLKALSSLFRSVRWTD